MKPFFLKCCLFCTIAMALVSCQEKAESPNIVIILADDQGWGDLGFNGNPVVRTPNLDKLAQEGAVLENFFVDAVCSPTRAALLSGKYAIHGGVYSTSQGGEILDHSLTLFPELFQQAGYKTAAFGKWHNGSQPPYHPNCRGFDEFIGYTSGHWGNYMNATLEQNGKIIKSQGYLTDYLTERAMEFMDKQKRSPFLLYLPLNTPHSPMQVPDKWWNKYENIDLPPHRYSDRENPNHSRAAYAMTENIDWNVGRLLTKLEELDLAENTLVIYFSDNGPNGWRWNGGMEGVKGSVDEGGVKAPCIIWGKDLVKPQKIESNTSMLDIFPTLLDMADLSNAVVSPLDGESLAELLMGEKDDLEDRTLVNFWKGRASLRTQTYRLDAENRLFDMVNDPGQTLDLSDSLVQITDSLSAFKAKWMETALGNLYSSDSQVHFVDDASTSIRKHPIHLPARDAKASGSIKRLSKWPNCSFFTNWASMDDSIFWDINLAKGGHFEVALYLTCKQENIGAQIRVGNEASNFLSRINETFDPPLLGGEYDRVKREESLVKEFQPLIRGTLTLKTGYNRISLKAVDIPGKEVADVRLLLLNRH